MHILAVIALCIGSFFIGATLGVTTMCLFVAIHDNNDDDNEVNNNGKEENI